MFSHIPEIFSRCKNIFQKVKSKKNLCKQDNFLKMNLSPRWFVVKSITIKSTRYDKYCYVGKGPEVIPRISRRKGTLSTYFPWLIASRSAFFVMRLFSAGIGGLLAS
jgi:hypothetical protein